jgi:hypothetical protein
MKDAWCKKKKVKKEELYTENGDSNCLFRAIAEQVYKDETKHD